MNKVPDRTEKTQPADADGTQVQPMIPGTQPEPLEELSAEERAEWRAFTRRMPIDWFPPETWPMLAQLCRHICQSRWVGQCLQEVRAGSLQDVNDEALERIERLQRLHDREGRAMTALMVRLRLTSQQRIQDADVADRARDRIKDEHVEVPPWMSQQSDDERTATKQ
jgi:hypothetical protein